MNPTQELSTEHQAVLVALQILEKVEAALVAKNDQALGHLEQLLDFFKGFVDRCHHGKEEDVLFPEREWRAQPAQARRADLRASDSTTLAACAGACRIMA